MRNNFESFYIILCSHQTYRDPGSPKLRMVSWNLMRFGRWWCDTVSCNRLRIWLLDSYRAGESSFKPHLHCNFMASCRRFDVLWGKGATKTASICFSRKILVKRAKTTWRWLIKPNTLVVRDLNIGSNYCRWFWFKNIILYCSTP